MTTNFGNIHGLATRVTERHAENADARLDIRRHDPDREHRRKNDDEPEKKIAFDTYDNAVVSVDALKTFLENFLKTLVTTNNRRTVSTAQEIVGATPSVKTQTVSAQASRAASLYKSAAKTAPRVQPSQQKEEDMPQSSHISALGNEDVRTIHKLLADIAILQSRKIDFLTIERNETFLASLAAAVAKALL